MLVLPDSSFNEILNFLDAVEVHGKNIKTVIDPLEEHDPKKTVTYEAKLLKMMFLRLREWSLITLLIYRKKTIAYCVCIYFDYYILLIFSNYIKKQLLIPYNYLN